MELIHSNLSFPQLGGKLSTVTEIVEAQSEARSHVAGFF